MTKQQHIRVLFADDEIPSLSDGENDRSKEELRKELAAVLPDFEAAYREDYEWFTELLRYLSVDMGFELLKVKSFMKAKEMAGQRDGYDVAVIDLSWTGDPGLAPWEKKNAGLEILRVIAEGNREIGIYKPTVAFSQNYRNDPELFATVLETGALPIPKEYTPMGHRFLAAAIKLMAAQSESSGRAPIRWDKATVHWLIGALTVPQMWKLAGAVVVVLATVATVCYRLGRHFALIGHR
jgi:hypothetical protein